MRDKYTLLEVAQYLDSVDEPALSEAAQNLMRYVNCTVLGNHEVLRQELIAFLKLDIQAVRRSCLHYEDEAEIIQLLADRQQAYENYAVVAKLMNDPIFTEWYIKPSPVVMIARNERTEYPES